MVREKPPDEQNLSVTRRLSEKLKATGDGEVAVPPDWVFMDLDEVLNKLQPVFYTDPVNAAIRAMGLQ